jgi:hypothetical protein
VQKRRLQGSLVCVVGAVICTISLMQVATRVVPHEEGLESTIFFFVETGHAAQFE